MRNFFLLASWICSMPLCLNAEHSDEYSCSPKATVSTDCDPCGESFYGEPGEQDGAIAPSAGPRVACGTNLFVTADFIYWEAREDNLGYAISGWQSFDQQFANQSVQNRGSIKHPDFKMSPGFKAGLGYNLDHDDWDVYAQYTWLYNGDTKDSTRRADASQSNLRATWFIVSPLVNPGVMLPGFPPVLTASTNWDLHFHVLDLEVGRNFFIGDYLTLRPLFGLKTSWQSQDLRVRYTAILSEAQPTNIDLFRMHQDFDYWGIGPRAGFNTAWYFVKNWAIYGDIALSALWSRFKVNRKDHFDPNINVMNAANAERTTLKTQNKLYTLLPVLEFGLGLRWDAWLKDEAYHLLIQAGWEFQEWWKMNQFYRIYEEGDHGDLSLQGFTLKFRFGF